MQLAHMIRSHGGDPDDPRFHLLYFSPVELQIDSLVEDIFRLIREEGVRRIVLDAIGDLITAARDPQRLHDYIYALSQHFATRGVTAVLTFETARPGITGSYSIDAPFSHLSDNIFLLEMAIEDDRTRRKVRILKTRASEHDPRVREVEITASGVNIL
jgi:circadian clock protein KaiC